MSSRHTRRKLAKAKQADKLVTLAQAERSRRIHAIVLANKSVPVERNYYAGITDSAVKLHSTMTRASGGFRPLYSTANASVKR